MQFHAKRIKIQAKINFKKTWEETAGFIEQSGRYLYWQKTPRQPHLLTEMTDRFRNIFLSYKFTEVQLPSFVPEADVYMQYGPEARVILDRIFYLAGLSRNNIYNRKTSLPPIIPSRMTLRSHMTASWFPLLAYVHHRASKPVLLFSIGKRYRLEQKLDARHLYESTSASLVVMAEHISVEDAKDLTGNIMKDLGFSAYRIITKKTASAYYAPGTDSEIFIRDNNRAIEVANFGFYSPVALANYKIRYPVFNLGFGVERVAMIMNGVSDIRKLVYPELYGGVA